MLIVCHLYLDLSSYLIVCAHIHHDRQALLGRHTSTGCVEGQFAHWDAHAIATQVSQSQDPLSIRHTHGLSINVNLSAINYSSHTNHLINLNLCLMLLHVGYYYIRFYASMSHELKPSLPKQVHPT